VGNEHPRDSGAPRLAPGLHLHQGWVLHVDPPPSTLLAQVLHLLKTRRLCFRSPRALSGQRGPLWWSSKHRRHHRFSDTANDPHSAAVDGIWYGLAGWYTDKSELQVDVPFVVPSLLTPELAVLDRLFFIPNLIEYAVLYHFFGWAVALYVGFASSTISLCATLWFNLEFHSGEESGSGYGTAVDATWSMFARLFLGAFLINFGIYVVSGSPIWFATLPIYLAYFLVGEHKHNHHHQHPNAAKRPGVDPFASTVMRGLAALGVVEWRPENWYK